MTRTKTKFDVRTYKGRTQALIIVIIFLQTSTQIYRLAQQKVIHYQMIKKSY